MDDRAALLAAILAEPDDLLPRLVFADYLEDHGESARAAWMRASCEPGAAVAGSAEKRRADGLFRAGRPTWWTQARPFNPAPSHGLFRLTVHTRHQARQLGRELWLPGAIRAGWVESVFVSGSGTVGVEMARWKPPLRGVALEAVVAEAEMSDDLTILFAAPNIRALSLYGRAMALPGLYQLGTRDDIREVKLAQFAANVRTDLLFTELARLAGLRKLLISGVGGSGPTAFDFRAVGSLVGLRYLTLSALPRLADADLAPLAGLTGLVRLELRDCPGVTDKGVAELRRALPGAEVVRG